ncbi:sulfite exporter TauE/SafE family protein [Phycicoccus avicenniae]|uniref:sulfite exporter TauE/SafE family protein n=1 Tax=Phycicoccus avicenniae TaxID=2828860 RepID=UPI003D295D08
MEAAQVVAVLAAGLVAGVLTSTVGVASLVSFPVLVAVGLPPVVANTSNTLGMAPAGVSGSFGYRRELREAPALTRVVLVTSALGAVGGAALLLGLPGSVFEVVVPWLVLGTSLLVGVQPRLRAWVARRAGGPAADPSSVSRGTRVAAVLTGVYGGYFGAGSGVMLLAVLGLGTAVEFRILNALKTFGVMVANLVAAVVFVLVAPVDWSAVLLLAAGSVVGGYVGSHIGRALPEAVLRALVVLAGTTAAVLLWLR